MMTFIQRSLSYFFISTIAFLALTGNAFAAPGFAGGTGTLVDPFVITNCQQLQMMQDDLGAHYALGGDIDCIATATWDRLVDRGVWDALADYTHTSQGDWDMVNHNGDTYYALQDSGPSSGAGPIEPGVTLGWADYWVLTEREDGHSFGFLPVGTISVPFTGSLDGNEYAISNLYINRLGVGDHVGTGLFGALRGVTVSDVTIVEADVTGDARVGILAGVIGGFIEAGEGIGYSGLDERSTIDNVVISGDVSGLGFVGGLAGVVFATTITDSSSSADVVSLLDDLGRKNGAFFGGLIGASDIQSILEDVSASGDIDGGIWSGGLLGGGLIFDLAQDEVPDQEDIIVIRNATASGDVQGRGVAGGLAGTLVHVDIQDAHATGDVSAFGGEGFNAAGGFVGSTDQATFVRVSASGNVASFVAGGFAGAMSSIGGGSQVSSDVTIHFGSAEGNVSGVFYSGGFVGLQVGGAIHNSFANGDVTGQSLPDLPEGLMMGGFTGVIAGDAVLEDVYAIGSVTGQDILGGFIGSIGVTLGEGPGDTVTVYTSATITNAYSLGQVIAPQDALSVGGFIAYVPDDEDVTIDVVSSYWNTETSGLTISAGGEGKTTAQMKNITTYTGWDMQSSTDNRLQYPTLSWQLGQNNPTWLIYQPPVRSRQSSGGSVQQVVSNLQNQGKTEQAQELKDQFPHLFEESPITVADDTGTPSSADILGSGACPVDLMVTNNMKQGDRDGRFSAYNNGVVTQVALLQAHINRILASQYNQAAGPVDGIFGPLTRQGVMRLQTALNDILKPNPILVIDGIVGPFTREAINNSCGIQE